MLILELRIRNLTREEMNQIDEQAAMQGMKRTAYAKRMLLGPTLQPELVRPMDDAELHMLIAAKAREGNMRALELLTRGVSVPVAGAGEPETPTNPFAEVIEMSDRRGT
jgi:hypothetical protein